MVEKKNGKILAVVGPTASGKTSKAVALAKRLDGEIISADSRQVYRNMDIGTGKDLEEYGEIPYHLIDICEAGEKYNLYRYINDFQSALKDIRERGKRPIVCGGTGMYVENALSGIRLPEVPVNMELRDRLKDKTLEKLTEILQCYKALHNTTDVDTVKRAIRAIEIEEFYNKNPELKTLSRKNESTPEDAVIIGVEISREARRERISLRLRKRIEEGMTAEIENLIKAGVNPEDLIYYGLEYKFVTLYIIGKLSYEEMITQLEIAIHQFAKRQMTWFRGMEKRGFHIHWLPYDLPDDLFIEEVSKLL